MSDHPDIEKLPLEIDGIPVRETIREIVLLSLQKVLGLFEIFLSGLALRNLFKFK